MRNSSHVNLRLERWHRIFAYMSIFGLVITGVLWLVSHYFLRSVTLFGESVHPLEPISMKLHGAGAMVVLFLLGSLMNSHIRRAFKAKRNLVSGLIMIVTVLVLIMTGYCLYYLADANTRALWSAIHWVIGCMLPIAIVIHIALGRKIRRTMTHHL